VTLEIMTGTAIAKIDLCVSGGRPSLICTGSRGSSAANEDGSAPFGDNSAAASSFGEAAKCIGASGFDVAEHRAHSDDARRESPPPEAAARAAAREGARRALR